jgi:hypothetical protein
MEPDQPLQIVREHVQAHLRAYPTKRLRQEVRRPHPGFDRSERVLDRLPPHQHFLGRCIEALLHGFQHALVFPSLDAPFLASCALGLQRALGTGRCPVNVQGHALLDGRIPPGKPFARRTPICIVVGRVSEV